MEVQVGFSTSGDLISRVIRFFTKATVSHTFLVIHSPLLLENMVIEAAWAGFRMTTMSRFKTKNTVVALMEPVVPLDRGLKRAVSWLGESYDYTGLFGMAYVIMLGRWLRRKVKNPGHNPHAVFCSEAVAMVLQESRYPGADELNPSETTPGDLYEFMRSKEKRA